MSASAGPDLITDGLVLYLDAADPKSYNGSGTTWFDRSGGNYNGNLIGTVYTDDSFYFNINLNSSCAGIVSYGDSFTVEIIFKLRSLNSVANGGTLIASSPAANLYYPIWISNENNKIKIRAYSSSTANFLYTTNQDIEIDKWYHITQTATRNSTTSLYINGEFDLNEASGPQLPNDYYTIGDLRVGRNLDCDADIAIVRIYNKELNSSEIQQNYNALKGRFEL